MSYFYIFVVSQNPRNHKLGPVADSVDRGVFDDYSWVGGEEDFQGHDYSSDVFLILKYF